MKHLGASLRAVVGLILAWCLGVAIVAPLNSWFVFQRPVALGVMALSLLVVLGSPRLLPQDGRVWPGTLAGALLGTGQALVTLGSYGWDALGVSSAATTIAARRPLVPHDLTYFARYPNNVPLLGGEVAVIRTGSVVRMSPGASLLVADLLLYTLVLAAVGGTLVALGRSRSVLPAQAAVAVLVGLSPMLGVPYSDLPAAAAVALALWSGARATAAGPPVRRAAWVLAAGLGLGVGIALKPFVAAVLVGVVVAAVAGRARRAAAPLLVGVAAVAAGYLGAGAAASGVTGLDGGRLAAVAPAYPVEHFLAMGTHDSGGDSPVRRFGAYSQPQVDATAALPVATRQAALRDTVRRQIAERGVAGNVRFFGLKAAWVWGDGTFWAQGEGADGRQALPRRGEVLDAVTGVLRAPGAGYIAKASAVQGVWLALLAVLVVGLLRSVGRRCDDIAGAALTALAVTLGVQTLYLMAFEARSRYLVALLPVVVVAVALAAPHAWRPRQARTQRSPS